MRARVELDGLPRSERQCGAPASCCEGGRTREVGNALARRTGRRYLSNRRYSCRSRSARIPCVGCGRRQRRVDRAAPSKSARGIGVGIRRPGSLACRRRAHACRLGESIDFQRIPGDPHVGGRDSVRRSRLILGLRERPRNSNVDNPILFADDSAAARRHEARTKCRCSGRIQPTPKAAQELCPARVAELWLDPCERQPIALAKGQGLDRNRSGKRDGLTGLCGTERWRRPSGAEKCRDRHCPQEIDHPRDSLPSH